MKCLFLDANILFTAAHNSSGKAALVLEHSCDWKIRDKFGGQVRSE